MSNLIFHSIEPEANKSEYNEFDTVTFKINTDRNLLRNSVRIQGKLRINSTGSGSGGTRAVLGDRIHLNKRIGAHALVEGFTTSVNGVVIESYKNAYPRFVHMVQSATKSQDDYYQGSQLCELKGPSTDVAVSYACGESDTSGAPAFKDIDFSFKPLIAINRADNDIQMSRLGNEIQVSLNLSRNESALCGKGAVAAANYVLSDLRMTFTSVPENPIPIVNMESVTEVKSSLQSNNASISTKVPAVCKSVSVSFIKQSKENKAHFDSSSLERPKGLSKVSFLFNDNLNQAQQFEQKDFGEFVDGYLESLGSVGVHSANPNLVKANSVFGLGLNFGSAIDMSKSKFTVDLQSDVDNTNTYSMFQYFHSEIQV